MADSVSISKFLNLILRHKAGEFGISINSEGYVKVQDIVNADARKEITLEQVLETAHSCPKKRFKLKKVDEMWYICSTFGHSMRDVKGDSKLITNPSECDFLYFQTHLYTYKKIMSAKCFEVIKRNHIHFSKTLPKQSSDRKVVICVDGRKAMNDGVKFYTSGNDFVTTTGINGRVSTKYIREIIF
jgi:RNA:NAD 2'-phosphotransferase (TPT1/KptA family)